MRFAVLQFGGSNCDQDAHHVIEDVCGVDCDLVWYKEGFRRSYDAIVIPGGFHMAIIFVPARLRHEHR